MRPTFLTTLFQTPCTCCNTGGASGSGVEQLKVYVSKHLNGALKEGRIQKSDFGKLREKIMAKVRQ